MSGHEALTTSNDDDSNNTIDLEGSDIESMFDFYSGDAITDLADIDRTKTEYDTVDVDDKSYSDTFIVDEYPPEKYIRHVWEKQRTPASHHSIEATSILSQGFIRLLEIDPAQNEDEPVTFKLHEVSMNSNPAYVALSYAWGNRTIICPVWVDTDRVAISETLRQALKTIRSHLDRGLYRSGSRPLAWVDALCINQENVKERNIQVAQMARIFSEAACVLVWLGNPEWLLRRSKPKDGTIPPYLLHDLYPELTNLPWFYRRWVVQEVDLAQECQVLLGSCRFPLAQLDNALARYEHRDCLSWRAFSFLPRKNMLMNMITYRLNECSDARDRVYALRAISSDGAQFPVDYTMNYWHLYVSFATHYVTKTWIPSLFACATASKTKGSSRPTWVPDWQSATYTNFWASRAWSKDFALGFEPYLCDVEEASPEITHGLETGEVGLDLNVWLSEFSSADAVALDAVPKSVRSFNSTYNVPTIADRICVFPGCKIAFGLREASLQSLAPVINQRPMYELSCAFKASTPVIKEGCISILLQKNVSLSGDDEYSSTLRIINRRISLERVRLI